LTHWQRAIDYIATIRRSAMCCSPAEIHDYRHRQLDWLLGKLRAIPHVELLRIGTKVPVVLPQRITRDLTQMLRRHHRYG